jgi:3-oxoacyl-[acyl-carrier-protein] synthase-1
MMPVTVLGCGMVTGIGLTASATCAALRAGLSGFQETRFMSKTGEWLIGCPVTLEQDVWRGRARVQRIVAPAIRECLDLLPPHPQESVPLLLCLAERDRPGRLEGLEEHLLRKLQKLLGYSFHARSQVFPRGRAGGVVALDFSRKLFSEEGFSHCILAGADTFLTGRTLEAYEAKNRLLTSRNSNGFIPGEAGCAVLLGPAQHHQPSGLRCAAIGFGRERATLESEEPLRGDGLLEAFRALQRDGQMTLENADYRITDCNGEQYGFKQDRLAMSRSLRKLKIRFDHLHPADCLGEIGAAVVPCALGMALTAAQKGYAPGPGPGAHPGNGVLCHFSNDDGERAALVLQRNA